MREVTLPPAPRGFSAVKHRITPDGRLVVLFSAVSSHVIGQGAPGQAGDSPTDMRLALLNDGRWRPLADLPLGYRHCEFDVTSDDRCIIAPRRWRPGGPDALVVSGKKCDRIRLGDGIEHLQCDANGDIWVGYFDEGIFGNWDWVGADGDRIPAAGIVRFSSDGVRQAALASPDIIADCYALNVGARLSWTCWYPDFRLTQLTSSFETVSWDNDTACGADGIAVEFPYVLFVGGYENDRDRLTLGLCEADTVRHVETFRMNTTFAANAGEPAECIARGNAVHSIGPRRWCTVTVGEIAADPERFHPTHEPPPDSGDGTVLTIYGEPPDR